MKNLGRSDCVMIAFCLMVFVAFGAAIFNEPKFEPASETESGIYFDEFEGDAAADASSGEKRSLPAAAVSNEWLLEEEKEDFANDPESYGWNLEDREFLQKHGTSESEARAAETILRENGLD